jgi:1,3-beta-glucan synthase
VIRYAILYFVLLVVFLVLIIGPIVAGKFLDVRSFAKDIPMEILQPVGYNNNDTSTSVTGKCLNKCPEWNGGLDATGGGGGDAADATDDAARRFRRYIAY